MIQLDLTPFNIEKDIASRVKKQRISQKLTQSDLAKKADIPLSTYRLFEQKGSISLSGLLKIAFALGSIDDFNVLFSGQKWNNIDEMLKSVSEKSRIRHD